QHCAIHSFPTRRSSDLDSPGLETAGENITSKDVPEMLEWETVTGIGEIQGVTTIGFVYKHNYELIKDTIASTTYARSIGKQVDGDRKSTRLNSSHVSIS